MSSSLDPEQASRFGPDLGPKGLQGLYAEDTEAEFKIYEAFYYIVPDRFL